MHYYLFAIDRGPLETLAALVGQTGFSWANVEADNDIPGWLNCSRWRRPDAVVVGTSRSEQGISREAKFRQAARQAALPVVVIEDYPGNYQAFASGEADLLVVESAQAASLARARLDPHCPQVVTGASMRYDGRRRAVSSLAAAGASQAPRVLWIGQPETEDALRSLAILLPHLGGLGVELLFRVHPRDQGYSRGDYKLLFEAHGIVVRDVSGLELASVLDLAPCLSLTQFSSLAVELGFLGIPMLHVLYPEAGQKRLRVLTGYDVPLVCQAGGSATITTIGETGWKLRQAIFDDEARQLTMQRFHEYFEAGTPQADKVAASIEHFLEHHRIPK